MEISPAVVAPSYSVLRPLQHGQVTPTFPVHQDLCQRMIASTDPDVVVRHTLAVCAGYAYSDAETVATMMARLGLDRNRCVRVSASVDAMFIRSTAYVVQSEDRRIVIVCYRGTEPANVINWLTDTDVTPSWVPFVFPAGGGQGPLSSDAVKKSAVHGGFYRNVRATRYAIAGVLQRTLQGLSIDADDETAGNPMEALYVTGHSLGGAMAAMFAVMLKTNSSYVQVADKVKAVYTYGQPMIGAPEFADLCDRAIFNGERFLAEKLLRFVYSRDLVPQLPPREAGRFQHFGREFRCGPLPTSADASAPQWSSARSATDQTGLLGVGVGVAALVTSSLARLRGLPVQQSIVDHGPQNYVAALAPEGVRSEFGD